MESKVALICHMHPAHGRYAFCPVHNKPTLICRMIWRRPLTRQ